MTTYYEEVLRLREALASVILERDKLNEGAQKLAKELHAAINEPMYAGTRADWKWRALKAEEELERLRHLTHPLQEAVTGYLELLNSGRSFREEWHLAAPRVITTACSFVAALTEPQKEE